MRIETKMLKKLLKELYPNQRFSVMFVSAKTYIDTSDKLKVKCPKNLNIKDVIQQLQLHTFGITVYKKNTFAAINGNNNTSSLIFTDGSIVDIDMVEFIEIDNFD